MVGDRVILEQNTKNLEFLKTRIHLKSSKIESKIKLKFLLFR